MQTVIHACSRLSPLPTEVGIPQATAVLLTCLALLLGVGISSPQPAYANDETYLEVYDVSDLVRPVRNFPAPRLGLEGLDESAVFEDDENNEAPWSIDELVELLRRHLGVDDTTSAGIQVQKLGRGQIVISGQLDVQKKVANALLHARRTPGEHYQMNAWLVSMTAAEFDELDLSEQRRKIVARRLVADHMKRWQETSSAHIVTAPQMVVFPHQLASVAMTQEKAYVADYRRVGNGTASLADPVVATLQEGLVLELRAKPIRTRRSQGAADRAYLLEWSASVCEAKQPMETSKVVIAGQELEIELPELLTKRSQSRATLRENEAVLIPGLDTAAQGDRRNVLILTLEATRMPPTQPTKPR